MAFMTLRNFLVSLCAVLCSAASVLADPEPMRTGHLGIEFALYFAPEPKTDPEPLLAILLKNDFPNLSRHATVRHKWTDIEKYAPPSPENFRYVTKGMVAAQRPAIARSTRVFILGFEATPTDLMAVNREACALVARLADATDGFPWDEECRLLYSREAWRTARVESWQDDIPDVRDHVNMHAYRNPELVRIITLGMRKFNLPDLVLSECPSSGSRAAGNLINACAQRLIEGQTPQKNGRFDLVLADIRHTDMRESSLTNPHSGATGKLLLKLSNTPQEPGDPDNTLWALEFPDAKGKTLMERQAAALASLYGAEDKVVNRRAGDAELHAASQKARKAFFAAAPTFRKGLQPNERLLVKSPFTVGDQTEYMWVEVTRWNGTSVEGVLINDSLFDKKLREGRRITVELKDVYDYTHHKSDGTTEGNETGKVLDRDGEK